MKSRNLLWNTCMCLYIWMVINHIFGVLRLQRVTYIFIAQTKPDIIVVIACRCSWFNILITRYEYCTVYQILNYMNSETEKNPQYDSINNTMDGMIKLNIWYQGKELIWFQHAIRALVRSCSRPRLCYIPVRNCSFIMKWESLGHLTKIHKTTTIFFGVSCLSWILTYISV